MSGDELEAIRAARGWSIERLAQELYRSRRMTIYYLRGEKPIPPLVVARAKAIRRRTRMKEGRAGQ